MDFQVYAQSNLFPRVLVYDTAATPGVLSKLIDLGYEIKSGDVSLYKSDQQPELSPAVQIGGTAILVALISWLLVRGLK